VTLSDEVRAHAARVAEHAMSVRIDLGRAADVEPGPDPVLDADRHFLEGDRADVAAYLLALTTVNFGSGWSGQLRKRLVAGDPVSGYFTVAMGITDRFRSRGPWTNEELRAMSTEEIATVLGQPPGLELMALYAQALRQLGRFLGERTPLQVVESAGGSAQRLAATVAGGMSMWHDAGFHKRAQILASDLALGGVARFGDLDTLTIFADNLVPHVLRCDGVLVYDERLAAHIDAGRLLTHARSEAEIRACAIHACVAIAQRLGVPERTLDGWLWNRGQGPAYKRRPRHRTQTIFY
jgi:hypothetical protein